MRRVFAAVSLLSLAACSHTPPTAASPHVILETELGAIEIEVNLDKAPLSGTDFLHYVDKGLYDQQGFYRTVRADNDPRNMGMSLIQGGRLDGEPVTELLPHEPTNLSGLSNTEGSISIARGEPGTGSAAFFFINIGDNSFLDHGGIRNPDGQGYTVFGHVVSGMDTVKTIQAREAKGHSESKATANQYLTAPVIIKKAYRK